MYINIWIIHFISDFTCRVIILISNIFQVMVDNPPFFFFFPIRSVSIASFSWLVQWNSGGRHWETGNHWELLWFTKDRFRRQQNQQSSPHQILPTLLLPQHQLRRQWRPVTALLTKPCLLEMIKKKVNNSVHLGIVYHLITSDYGVKCKKCILNRWNSRDVMQYWEMQSSVQFHTSTWWWTTF